MSDKANEELRAALKAAAAKVRRQIEVQAMSDHYVGSGRITEEAIVELRSELQQLEEALANLA